MKPIKLAMNAVCLLSPATGIASYTRNLAERLLQSGEVEARFFYLRWSENLRDTHLRGMSSFKKMVVKMVPSSYQVSRLVQQRLFDTGIREFHPDIYHEPNYLAYRFEGPTVITVHDLSHIRYPETHPDVRVRAMNRYLGPAIERAARIIVDSDFVRTEVAGQFGVDRAKIDAIHLGVSTAFSPRTREELAPVLQRYALTPGKYLFAVGTLEPRKNLIQAIDAHAALPEQVRRKLPLVIAGMKGWLTSELDATIRAAEERGEVRWLGYVPAEDLPLLYSGARLVVYPSLYEGFGLPVLEAMASGVPVITSNQASLPEVAGEAAIMVDPRDVDALRDAMEQLIEDEQEAKRRASLGLAQAARFTWGACAEKTLAVYRDALQAAGHK